MRQRTCACGHTRGHPEVAQDPEYTLWGWIQLSMLGITPLPERIVFRCRRCGKSLGVTRDPALLRKRGVPDAPDAANATATATASSTATVTEPEKPKDEPSPL